MGFSCLGNLSIFRLIARWDSKWIRILIQSSDLLEIIEWRDADYQNTNHASVPAPLWQDSGVEKVAMATGYLWHKKCTHTCDTSTHRHRDTHLNSVLYGDRKTRTGPLLLLGGKNGKLLKDCWPLLTEDYSHLHFCWWMGSFTLLEKKSSKLNCKQVSNTLKLDHSVCVFQSCSLTANYLIQALQFLKSNWNLNLLEHFYIFQRG